MTQITNFSRVQIICSCPSFKFEFVGSLLKTDSVIERVYFEYANLLHKKNVEQIPSGCKHIVALANHIKSKLNVRNFGLHENIRLIYSFEYLYSQIAIQNYNPRDPYQISKRQKIFEKLRKQQHLKSKL